MVWRLACWGDHFEVNKADDAYCRKKKETLAKYGLKVFAISNHLVGQAITDRIDQRHKSILPAYVWGDGDPEGVRKRAANEMVHTAEAAKRLGVYNCKRFYRKSDLAPSLLFPARYTSYDR